MNKLPMLSPWLRRFFTEHISTERNLAVNTRKSYRDTFVMLLPYIATHSRKSVERLLISDITAQRVLGFLNHIETERRLHRANSQPALERHTGVYSLRMQPQSRLCRVGRQPACHCQ